MVNAVDFFDRYMAGYSDGDKAKITMAVIYNILYDREPEFDNPALAMAYQIWRDMCVKESERIESHRKSNRKYAAKTRKAKKEAMDIHSKSTAELMDIHSQSTNNLVDIHSKSTQIHSQDNELSNNDLEGENEQKHPENSGEKISVKESSKENNLSRDNIYNINNINNINAPVEKKEEEKERINGKENEKQEEKPDIVKVDENPKTVSKEQIETNLRKRIHAFGMSLAPYVDEFGKDMIRDFFEYWTEPNKSGTKFRKELEATWDTHRRLCTWRRNNDGWAMKRGSPAKKGIGITEALKFGLGGNPGGLPSLPGSVDNQNGTDGWELNVNSSF